MPVAGRRSSTGDESPVALKRRARKIGRILGGTYPYAVAELDFRNAFELLVATVLSAQTTDVRVNLTTPALFERYPDARALSEAQETELQEIIRPTGFYRAKTNSLLALSRRLVDEYDGVGYSRAALAAQSVVRDDPNNRAELTATSPVSFGATVAAGTRNAQGAILYKHVGADSANIPIAFIDTGGFPLNGGGGPFEFAINAEGILQAT